MENLRNIKSQLTEQYQKHRLVMLLALLAAAAVLPHLLNNNYYIGIATKKGYLQSETSDFYYFTSSDIIGVWANLSKMRLDF